MNIRYYSLGLLVLSSVCAAQTVEYSKKLNGSLEISSLGQVGKYQLDSSGIPSVDQNLGTSVQSWRFSNQQPVVASKSNNADFTITLLRPSLSDQNYSIKRVELFQKNVNVQIHAPITEEELAYCKQDNAAPKLDVVCTAVMPNDPELSYSAEVYVAIKKTDAEPLIGIESLYLYSAQNNKLISKFARNAKEKYTQAAITWAKKNSQSFLQNRQAYIARVEFVIASNTSPWRRQENWAGVTESWINDEFRAQTKYASQGGWELTGK
jgi:hypothetical protein